jgi:hypothetical protein
MRTRVYSSVISPYAGVDFTPLSGCGPYHNGMEGEYYYDEMGLLPQRQRNTFGGLPEMVAKVPGGYMTIAGVAAAVIAGVAYKMKKKK